MHVVKNVKERLYDAIIQISNAVKGSCVVRIKSPDCTVSSPH